MHFLIQDYVNGKRLLITEVSGFLASNPIFCLQAREYYSVYMVDLSSAANIPTI